MIIWQPNQTIQKGRFIIQKVLGSGGFGITYKALEPSTGKLYAIKTLNQTMQMQHDVAEQQVKFINEALTIKAFEHPHVVKVYEVIQENELFGMVMEYIDGIDLSKYVQQKGHLPESEALLYIDQIGQALEYIHQKGHLHRDIKPQNILLRQDKKEAVLVDFGLARNIATKSMTNSLTEGFAPLEQYRRKGNFGTHTDVYALAATLYYLLTADALKAAKSEIVDALNRKYENEPLPEPKYYNSQVSQRVNDAILAGMEIEPEQRTPTVLKFRENLGLVIQPIVKTPHIPTRLPEKSLSSISNYQEVFTHQNFAPQPVNQEVQLESAVNIDYRRLLDLLTARKWKEADKETARVMLVVAKRDRVGWLDIQDINNFPCKDLCTIDQLWLKYSNGKFGFSVQKEIYQSLGGTREYNRETWEAFGDTVGWRQGESWLSFLDLNFDRRAVKGHLPWVAGGWVFLWQGLGFGWVLGSLLSRVETCYFSNKKSEIEQSKLSQLDDIRLVSAAGIDYKKLHDLLATKNWKEADEETAQLILAVAKREKEGWLDIESIDKFPCEYLRKIDQLWVKYSNGKFGFSVQKQIYQSLGGTREYNKETWEAFGDTVGWRKAGNWLYYSNTTFDTKTPKAHLPWVWRFCGIWGEFFSHVETYDIPNDKSQIQHSNLSKLNQVELISSLGMNYTKLRDLLAAGKWKEADELTGQLMLAVAKKKEDWLNVESIDNFPCEDLRTIDQLWVISSNSKFGFSIQKEIYTILGGTRKYDEKIWDKFGEAVGWRRKRGSWLYYWDINFDIRAPIGHLPVLFRRFLVTSCASLLSRQDL